MFRAILSYVHLFNFVLLLGIGIGYWVGASRFSASVLSVVGFIALFMPALLIATLIEGWHRHRHSKGPDNDASE